MVMPTYEYECRSCGSDFDVFQSMSDEPLKVCPSCGNAVKRKISSGTGIIFKGSGFYKNDSRKSSSASSGDSSRGDSAVKGNSAAKSDSADKSACASCPAAAGASSEAAKKDST
jgi:putative FmdB family regulatory protein